MRGKGILERGPRLAQSDAACWLTVVNKGHQVRSDACELTRNEEC